MEEEGDRLDMALLFPSLLVPSPFLPQGMLEEPGAPGRAEELEQASVTGVCGQQLVTVTWDKIQKPQEPGKQPKDRRGLRVKSG